MVLAKSCYRQLDPLQGLESWLWVHLMGRKPFKQGLQAAPRRTVVNMWNKSVCRAAAVVRSSAAGAGHPGTCVLQGRVVLWGPRKARSCFLPGGGKNPVRSHLRSAKRTKQEIRELMMLVIVDQRSGEKAFTPAALFSLPVETDGSQAWINCSSLTERDNIKLSLDLSKYNQSCSSGSSFHLGAILGQRSRELVHLKFWRKP